jgi:hypothetical protein
MAAKTEEVEVDLERVWKLLRGALEQGGSGRWCLVIDFIAPPEGKLFHSREETPSEIFEQLDYPLSEGGAIVITTPEGRMHACATRWRLNLASIRRGLKAMAAYREPRYWKAYQDENYDPSVGNVFLQLCLWGEVYYS